MSPRSGVRQAATRTPPRTKKATRGRDKAATGHDQFGLRRATATSKAAGMFTKGCQMGAVKKATLSNQYNILRWLEAQGHKVTRKDGFITVVPKAG